MIEAGKPQNLSHPKRSAIRFILPLVAYLFLIPATLHGYVRNDLAKDIASQFGGQIDTDIIILTFVVLCVTAYQRHKSMPGMVWWALDLALATGILVDSGKLLGLRRPNGGPFGFPSGHTGMMFSLSWLMEEMYPSLGPLWYVMAVVMGWSRIEVSAHFPYQVLAGAPMGFAVAWAVTTLPEGIFVPRLIDWFQRRRVGG